MSSRYENPLLYSSVNQPVDKKTGLIVQQEVPVCQLGRLTEKHDQGFLEIVADRAVAKFFGKKGKRGTAIFLPDRIRFTKKGFREILFYREIKVCYKSDPQTYCFVLFVIDEKTAKRRYEVYQCDNLEDVRRIEDILEIARHTANSLLLDPDPIDEDTRRRSLPSAPNQATRTRPREAQPNEHNLLECPHCKRLSVVASENSANLSFEHENKVSRYPPISRSKSENNINEDDWPHIRDRWRDADYPEQNHDAHVQRTKMNRYRDPARPWDNGEYYEIPERHHRQPSTRQSGKSDLLIKPYHVASTYGPPRPLNKDYTLQHALHQGKPRLNRKTMQIMEPYMEAPLYRLRPYRSTGHINDLVHHNERTRLEPIEENHHYPMRKAHYRSNGISGINMQEPIKLQNRDFTVTQYREPSNPTNRRIIIEKILERKNSFGDHDKGNVSPESDIFDLSDGAMYFERFPNVPQLTRPNNQVLKSTGVQTNSEKPIILNHQNPFLSQQITKTIIEYDQNPTEVPRLYTGQ
ncbi:hypothetical protein FGIG_07402 [Fasciola gigantica]|uniref:Trematode PH-like domain-containing protein n=1 Tax=Fasciola gigantica TaxID=46835 RepID=A0A504YR23_FASGI|nr:hypothetical protein FGIG_07402 [Fasciola gigantica]